MQVARMCRPSMSKICKALKPIMSWLAYVKEGLLSEEVKSLKESIKSTAKLKKM
jgi:hypothetical protein